MIVSFDYSDIFSESKNNSIYIKGISFLWAFDYSYCVHKFEKGSQHYLYSPSAKMTLSKDL